VVPTFVEATWGAFSALAFTAGFAEALSRCQEISWTIRFGEMV
jgi:hypothetical protein